VPLRCFCGWLSVVKVASTGEVHGDPRCIGSFDDVVEPYRSSGLNDGGHTGVNEDLQAILEWEERSRRGYRTGCPIWGVCSRHVFGTAWRGHVLRTGRRRPQSVGTLNGESAGVQTVNLAHADPDGGAVGRQQDGVGFWCTHGLPRKHEILHGLFVGGLSGSQFPVRWVVTCCLVDVGILDEHAAGNLFELFGIGCETLWEFQQANILLSRQDIAGFRAEPWSDDNFSENILDLLSHGS